jgi:maltooligosyltrehalose trehalohydrolase
LDWSELEKEPHATLWRTHRELIALRKRLPELSDPWLDGVGVDVHESARTLVVHRGALRVVVNLGPEPVTLALGATITRILLASEPTQSREDEVTVPAEAFAIAQIPG